MQVLRLRFMWAALFAALTVGAATPGFAQAADDDDDILVAEDEDEGSDAAAANFRKVGLVPLVPIAGASAPLAGQVTDKLKRELGDNNLNVKILPLKAAGQHGAAPTSDPKAEKALGRAERAQTKGRAALKKLRFGPAVKLLKGAVTRYERAASLLENFDGLFAAYTGLAEAAARQGDDAQATAWLEQMSAVNPEHELDVRVFPPNFINAHRKVRAALLDGERGSIVVDASGAGADVFVDGRNVGKAPVTITALPAGRHFVRVVQKDVGLMGAVVDITAGASETVSPGFVQSDSAGPSAELAGNTLSPESATAIAAAARAAGVEVAVVGVVTKQDASVPAGLVLVRAEDGALAELPALAFDGDLLNLSIEALKISEGIGQAFEQERFAAKGASALLEGVNGAAVNEMRQFTMRYRLKTKRPRSVAFDDGEKRAVLAGGSGGGRRSSLLDDEEDTFGGSDDDEDTMGEADPDDITQAAWFYPAVIGGSIAGVVLIGGGVTAGLASAGVIDVSNRTGTDVSVTLP